MRRRNPKRPRAAAIWAVALVLTAAGADNKIPSLKDEVLPKAEETVGDIAFARANDTIRVEGVGLVIGLNNTGSNPAPSLYRTELLHRMRQATVPNAELWLEHPSTSLVLVQGVIPQGISTTDRFDIDVTLPPGSTTTSLRGGHLLVTELKVKGIIDGKELDGQLMGEAYGPVMVGNAAQPDELKVGRILGGARVYKELPYSLILKDGRQGFRTADILQRVINMRFYARKGTTTQEGMARATQPDFLVLKVPKVYHHNQLRYFQVIERLPMLDTPELREKHLRDWTAELLDPKTAGVAALKLEGIGRNAAPALKEGLQSPSEQVRFFAAEALAYLNDPAGVDVLTQTASEHAEFRAHALAALAALGDSAAILRLRQLMDQPDPELRYGAFNALRTIDEFDAFLGRVRLLRPMPVSAAADDELALRLYSAPSQRSVQVEDPFELYVVECDGPPLIHVARSRRREVVIFGRGARLQTPIAVGGTGPILLNANLADSRVQISRFSLNEPDGIDRKVESDLELGRVLSELANLGATYPEVVAILQAAAQQKNLPGPLMIDAIPGAGTEYDAAQRGVVDATAETDPALQRAGFTGTAAEPPPAETRSGILSRLRRRLGR